VLIQQEGCTSDQECGDSEICTDGACTPIEKPPATECETDEQCALGETCVDYVCKKETPAETCQKDADCKTEETCVNNSCAKQLATKSYLLSILFMVFGIAIMGGAGYFLYQQNEEKKAAAARRVTTAYAKPGSMGALRPMNPELEAKYAQERAVRQKALQEEYAKRSAE